MIEFIRNKLFELQDIKYRDFCSKLLPTVKRETIIGIKTPQLRILAKELYIHPDINEFLNDLPHKYYEENNLHAFLIEQIRDYDLCMLKLNCFLPYIDNWGTCDSLRPKVFKNNTQKLIKEIRKWVSSKETYTVRFGIEMLMCFYLDENFILEYVEMVSKIKSNEYYINMMIAWYFATALAKQYDKVIPYFEMKKLQQWTHNKAIQKARESFRITKKQKEYLNTLKIK